MTALEPSGLVPWVAVVATAVVDLVGVQMEVELEEAKMAELAPMAEVATMVEVAMMVAKKVVGLEAMLAANRYAKKIRHVHSYSALWHEVDSTFRVMCSWESIISCQKKPKPPPAVDGQTDSDNLYGWPLFCNASRKGVLFERIKYIHSGRLRYGTAGVTSRERPLV